MKKFFSAVAFGVMTVASGLAQSVGFPRVQVIEDVTGTWCGYCVRAIVGMEQLKEQYPDNFIGISAHYDDVFQTSTYTGLLNRATSYPYAVMNRTYAIGTNPDQMLTAFSAMPATAEGEAHIVEAQYTDSKYTAVRLSVESRFAATQSMADYRLAFVVVEDSIRAKQTNAYAGGETPMGGFESMTESPYIYLMDVARCIDSYEGIAGSVPAQVKAGQTYVFDYTLTMPKVSRRKNVSIVVLLYKGSGTAIVNASRCRHIADYEADGISQTPTSAPYSASSENYSASRKNYSASSYDFQGRSVRQPRHGQLLVRDGRKVLY